MKNILLLTFIFSFNFLFVYSQTILSLGDIAFVGYNCIPATNSDEFSFVILKTGGITSGTQITFTDMNWKSGSCGFDNFCTTSDNSSYLEGSSNFTWTSGSTIPYGGVVKISGAGTSTSFTCSNGSATGQVLNLQNSGDQIFALQGGVGGTMLAAIHANKATATGCSFSTSAWDNCTSNISVDICQSTGNSNKPPCLTVGENCIVLLDGSSNEVDNGLCNSSLILTGVPATDRVLINTLSNWSTQNLTAYTLYTTTFSIGSAPTITTTTASSIGSTTATSGGNVSSDGGFSVTAKGVCWSTSANPTTSNSKTSDGTGTGSFSSSITGLSTGTTYHYRAYATNSAGTSYGSDLTFTTTSPVTTPTISTTTASSVTNTTASSGGVISSDGGASITAKGVCWSISSNPTIADSKTSDGTGTSTFTSAMTGLSAGTLYHYRAYATNSAGTSYGSDLTFTTTTVPTLFVSTSSGPWTTAGTWVANVVPSATDYAQINSTHNVTVSGNTSITNLILKSGSTVTVSGTAILTITGYLQDEGGSFSIASGAKVLLNGNIKNSSSSNKIVNSSTSGLIIYGNEDVQQ